MAQQKGESDVWADNEVESLLNIKLEYEDNEMQVLPVSTFNKYSRCKFMRTHVKTSAKIKLKQALFWFCAHFIRCCLKKKQVYQMFTVD